MCGDESLVKSYPIRVSCIRNLASFAISFSSWNRFEFRAQQSRNEFFIRSNIDSWTHARGPCPDEKGEIIRICHVSINYMSVCTWAVIPTAFQCHILSYPNSVRFSWCRTVPVHLNNRFSVIQSTAHNSHLTCAHDVCHLRTNEQIARDALAYESTFSDTTEWTISVIRWERERKMCLEIKTNIGIRHSVELKKRDYYGNVGGFVRLCLGSHSLGTWKMFANFIIWRWLCDVVCTRTVDYDYAECV